MDIGSVITAGILSGALVFGHTASETGFPKEIDEGTYNLVPAYVQEINWSDDSSKLNRMYTKSYIDNNGVLVYTYFAVYCFATYCGIDVPDIKYPDWNALLNLLKNLFTAYRLF